MYHMPEETTADEYYFVDYVNEIIDHGVAT